MHTLKEVIYYKTIAARTQYVVYDQSYDLWSSNFDICGFQMKFTIVTDYWEIFIILWTFFPSLSSGTNLHIAVHSSSSLSSGFFVVFSSGFFVVLVVTVLFTSGMFGLPVGVLETVFLSGTSLRTSSSTGFTFCTGG